MKGEPLDLLLGRHRADGVVLCSVQPCGAKSYMMEKPAFAAALATSGDVRVGSGALAAYDVTATDHGPSPQGF